MKHSYIYSPSRRIQATWTDRVKTAAKQSYIALIVVVALIQAHKVIFQLLAN